jgi:DNA-binding transcriptional MerR regulator
MTTAGSFWTIDELGARVALALSMNYEGQANGQVRAVPDRRTIRYYTTLGLIDRPAEIQGRTAFYGLRHLLQLVAIKRLQTRGLSLAEIQHQLLGATDATLHQIAQLPADLETSSPPAPPDAALADSTLESREEPFWTTLPALPPEGEMQPPAGNDLDGQESGNDPPLQGIRLAEEVILLLPPARPIDEEDIPAVRAAAAPLLKLLEKRRLLRPRQERRCP